MEQLEDGRFAIDSAFEAEVLGRAVSHGAQDGSSQYYFRHPGYEYPSRDEGEFFDREQRVGRLLLTKRLAGFAESGINSIISSGRSFNGVTPSVAQIFRTSIDRSRAHRVLSEVPTPAPATPVAEVQAEAEVVAA